MKEDHVCAQDLKEQELKKQGKTYFRIGRAIFIVETCERKQTLEETLETPIGTAALLAGTAHKLAEDEETMKMIHGLFMPTGFLRITVEGDPDAGLGLIANEVLLSGYRYGLDDVIVDGELLKTTHGSRSEILRNFGKFVERQDFWAKLEKDEKLKRKIRRTAKSILEVADALEKLRK